MNNIYPSLVLTSYFQVVTKPASLLYRRSCVGFSLIEKCACVGWSISLDTNNLRSPQEEKHADHKNDGFLKMLWSKSMERIMPLPTTRGSSLCLQTRTGLCFRVLMKLERFHTDMRDGEASSACCGLTALRHDTSRCCPTQTRCEEAGWGNRPIPGGGEGDGSPPPPLLGFKLVTK